MIHFSFGFRAVLFSVFLAISSFADESKPELVIYAYDSLVAQGGLGSEIFPRFEALCDCKVRAISAGDGGQLLSRLQLDERRKKSVAHVVFGIDQQLWPRLKPFVEEWGSWTPAGYSSISSELRVESGFLPFDHGFFALMVDRKSLGKWVPPRSLAELASPKWKRKLILQDPRTSTPGLSFLLFTQAIHGDATREFWSKFKGQWLTLTPGWDEAYGLFLKGEAPMVWSYTTSEAYHRENGDAESRYQAVVFKEGNPVQIEGAAVVKGLNPEDSARARRFLEFLISSEVQKAIPKKNWMLPVVSGTQLPESFKKIPAPVKMIRIGQDREKTLSALADWSAAVEGEHKH